MFIVKEIIKKRQLEIKDNINLNIKSKKIVDNGHYNNDDNLD